MGNLVRAYLINLSGNDSVLIISDSPMLNLLDRQYIPKK